MDREEIMEGLGFNFERRNGSYEYWRHKTGPQTDLDFLLVLTDDYDCDDAMKLASEMLIKIGQHMKMEQLTKYVKY